MYEFCYDYVNPKYVEISKLCYMDTDSFMVSIETKDVETRFDTSNYGLQRPLPNGKIKKSLVQWLNKGPIARENNDIICRIKAENI